MDEKILKNLNPYYTDGREKIESIEHVIYNVNRYIRSPEELNESFTEFITQVISKVLQHPIVYGQKGDEMASDLIFRCTKLFVNFCAKNLAKKKVSTELFGVIRNIFDKYYEHSFFVTKDKDKDTIRGTHKELTYEDFDKFFQQDFIIERHYGFNPGENVDVYVSRYNPDTRKTKKEWTRGKIIDVLDKDKEEYRYDVQYYREIGVKKLTIATIPHNSYHLFSYRGKTKYLDFRIDLKPEDDIDICIERDKEKFWCKAKVKSIADKNESNNEDKDSIYFSNIEVEYIDKKNNIESETDKSILYGYEKDDFKIPFDSYRIQKPGTLSNIQNRINKMISNGKTELSKNYKDLLNFINDFLENDQSVEDFYKYEGKEDGNPRINYIVGKYEKNYSFYFTKLLKAMADNGHFETLITILIGEEDKGEDQKEKGEKNKEKNYLFLKMIFAFNQKEIHMNPLYV